MSYCRTNRVIFIIIISLAYLLNETRFTGSPAHIDALIDAQREEINKLRAELENAFEKDDEQAVAAKGVVVQPSWTKDSKTPQQPINNKVEVTKQSLDEVKALRDSIVTAVKEDSYAKTVESDNTKFVQELHKQYVQSDNNRNSKTTTVASTSQLEENISGGPNVVESSAENIEPDFDIRKLQRLELNKRRTREALVLESIEEDFSFNLGEHVQEWEHILHGGQEFFIGRLENDLQIVHKNAMQYEPGNLLHIGSPITYLETYSFWNFQQQQQEGIILVATGNKVLWYRGEEKSDKILQYWEWVVGNTISGLTYFTADSQDYLVVSSNQSSLPGHYALNIYQFDLKNKEFWIAQRIQLSHPCSRVTFLDTGRDFILAFPQNDTAVIYTFNPTTDTSGHLRFQPKYSYDSEGIEYITAFQMGGRSYLALGGLAPKILLYQQGKLIPRTIFGNNFGLVEFFFPIPVRTYRDDLLLLVQHRVNFSTHSLTVLETLIWDGEAFEATIPAPCKLGQHNFYGVGCMLDPLRDPGLKGATVLRRGDEILVIVPRHEAPSGLFRLNTKLLAKNSELMDLQDIYTFLQEWVAEQEELIEKAQQFLAGTAEATMATPDISNLDTLITPELFFAGSFDELYVNDYKWTEHDTHMQLSNVMNEIENLGQELGIARRRRNAGEFDEQTSTYENLDFDEVEAEILELEKLNDVPFYVKNGQMDFEGILNLVELEVEEKEHLREPRQALLDEMSFEEDLEFEKINGVVWQDMVDNMVLRNKFVELEHLEVDGEVVAEDRLNVEHLNYFKFPDDFLWSVGSNNPIVTAEKNFTGTLGANHVDTVGIINGKNPLGVITVAHPQELTGFPTFANMEVSETFELNGAVRGSGLEDYPPNLTLEETNSIFANCLFENLQVLGPIILQENFENETLDNLLSDIAQYPVDPNTEIHISAPKTFDTVEFPVDFHILDNTINDIAIGSFVPQHTEQDFNFSVLKGYAYFNNLTITGFYDGVLINELSQQTIKVDEPQYLPKAQLNFVNDVNGSQISVIKTVNTVPIATNFQTTVEDLVIPEAHFETLKTETANIPGNISGNGRLNGLNLTAFLKIGKHKNSTLHPSNIFVDELVLPQGLEVDKIQGLNAVFLYEFLDEMDTLPEMVLDAKILVDHITVAGDVQAEKLNGQSFDEDIQMTAVWLNRPNYLSTKLKFSEPVDLQSDLVVLGDYNEQNLNDLIDDMVFRSSNGTVLILATKNFMSDVNVMGNTRVDAINGIPFTEIGNKRKGGLLKGSLKVKGNLHVSEVNLNGSLNKFPISNLTNLIRYDEELRALVLRGNITFNTDLELEDLTVQGDLNGFKQLRNFFENLVHKQRGCVLRGEYNFTGRVAIENGAHIDNLNGHDLRQLFNNMVFVDGVEPILIESPILFTSSINAVKMNVQSKLKTDNLNGCSVGKWLEDTLRVDRTETITKYLRFSSESLNDNSFYVSYLNNMDLSKVITLHTPQNLTDHLTFSEVIVEGGMSIEGPVNGVDLETEFENTMLTYDDQHITIPLNIQNVNVLHDFEAIDPINGDKDLRDVATIDEDLEFESPLYFKEIKAYNVFTEDQISGIDFNDWYENSLWTKGRGEQHISGNWSVKSLRLQNGPNMPEYILGDPHSSLNTADHEDLCLKLSKLESLLISSPYHVKHLEKNFVLDMDVHKLMVGKEIRKAFSLVGAVEDLLLINFGCYSAIFKYFKSNRSYEILNITETGFIDQLLVIKDKTLKANATKFMTNTLFREVNNCSLSGLKLWQLEFNNLIQLTSFEGNVSEFWTSSGKGVVFGITDTGVKQFSTQPPYTTKPWNLLPSTDLGDFSYFGLSSESGVLYGNGTHFAQIIQSGSSNKRQRRNLAERYPSENYARPVHTLRSPDESILKPNDTEARRLTFADFIQVIENILEDLDYRLGVEINITQLSIPETDLYEAHLIQDFIAIMEELYVQDIYPPDTFTDINLSSIQIPENPAQVLAARTVQIVWPVIVEIDEVHTYLRGNNTIAHPISACILTQLGLAIHDVLFLANNVTKPPSNDTVEHTKTLSAVIGRIRQFQNDLKELKTNLKVEIEEELVAEIIDEEENEEIPENKSENSEELVEVSEERPNELNFTIQVHKQPKSKSKNFEVLNFEVGPQNEPYDLLAVTMAESQIAPGIPGGIKLYVDILENKLFQFIPAHRPRALASLRLRDVTLLAFVENCCTINVLQYRGIEGFVDFAKFDSEVPVRQLLTLSLRLGVLDRNYYLVAVLKRKLVFYKIVTAGLTEIPELSLERCD